MSRQNQGGNRLRDVIIASLVFANIATAVYFLWPKIDSNKRLEGAISTAAVKFQRGLDNIGATPMPSPTLTPTPTPEPTLAISGHKNPFLYEYKYDARQSFELLLNPIPVNGLEGTLAESYSGHVSVVYGSVSVEKPFTWVVLRDQQGELLYLIYPVQKTFFQDHKLQIGRYWPVRDNVTLMNNMLAYLLNPLSSWDTSYTYESRLDFPIQSAADDGHIDGIIEYDSVRDLSAGE